MQFVTSRACIIKTTILQITLNNKNKNKHFKKAFIKAKIRCQM